MKTALLTACVMGCVALGSGPAVALPTYVGSWIVGDGPVWTSNPPVYSGQEAAALLFGGTPGEYVISTVSDDPTTINYMSWADTYTVDVSEVGESYSLSDCGGTYDCGGSGLATSAYVLDHTCDNRYSDLSTGCSGDGTQYVNYAFLGSAPVPEPTTLVLVGTALAGLGLSRRRRPI